MKKCTLVVLLLCVAVITNAQKKNFTFDQLFGGQFPNVMERPPYIDGWAGDDHYLETRVDENGTEKVVSVNALTGKAAPYVKATVEEPGLPSIPGAVNSTLSPDGKYLAYTKDNDLYVSELATKTETALTTDGSETILNGYASWVYYEEILGRASRYKAFWWSPDSKHIAFMRFDDSQVPVFPIYVADGQRGYLERTRYPKAGDKNPEVKIGIAQIVSPSQTDTDAFDGNTPSARVSEIVWADFNAGEDQYFGTPAWTPDNQLWVQWMNRGQDMLKVYEVNKTDGSKKAVYTENQPTWIVLDDSERFHFLPSGNGVLIKSDKEGWQNLYLHDKAGKQIAKVTDGNFWDISVMLVDEKNKQVFFKARKDHSARYDLYRSSFDGKGHARLTFGDYSHDIIDISPTGKYFITTYSNLGTPPVMTLVNNKGKVVRALTELKGPAFEEYNIARTKLITVKSADGKYDLPLTITYPIGFDSAKKYPVWISIYGGPDAGSVYDRWRQPGGLAQWWAQEGIIQVTMDNRSSGHFGKTGINEIHKQLGMPEIQDYMHCAQWLRSQAWVDSSKVGITGGSFGGYLTCMALTYGADVFTHGIANYSVTDWQLYDTHYTERFMKTPQQNAAGYEKTSAMTYADRYKGILRIVHGTTDDNVHMQNSIQLVNKLQDMNRFFEVMIYPNQRHGIGGKKARHNFTETCRFVYRYLLEKELPDEFVK